MKNILRNCGVVSALVPLAIMAVCSAQITAERLATIPEGSVKFSDATKDGQHAVLAVDVQGTTTFVLDDKVIQADGTVAYDAISLGAGGRLAYPEETADGKWHVVVDSKAGPGFDEIMTRLHNPREPNGSIIFSHDGRHFAYAGRQGSGWMLIFDGREGPPFSKIIRASFSSDGNHLAYLATKQGQWIIMEDEQEVGSYNQQVSNLAISADGKRLAWVAGPDESKQVIVNGQAERAYAYVDTPVFSDDGRHVAYVAHLSGAQSIVVVDGQEDRPNLDVRDNAASQISASPVFSHDGQHIAFAIGNAWSTPNPYVLDGQVHPAGLNERGIPETFGRIEFTPTGQQVVCIGEITAGGGTPRAEQRMVIDGTPDDWHGIVSYPIFSADGKRRAYIAITELLKSAYAQMIVDGSVGPQFDILLPAVFSPNNEHVAYGELKGTIWSMNLDGNEIGDYGLVVRTPNGKILSTLIDPEYQDRYSFDSSNLLRFMGTSNGVLYRVTVSPSR